MTEQVSALITLNPYQARITAAIFERFFPADEYSPGAIQIAVVTYIDRALAGAYRDQIETYRVGLSALDAAARQRHGTPFADCNPQQQDDMLDDMEQGKLKTIDDAISRLNGL